MWSPEPSPEMSDRPMHKRLRALRRAYAEQLPHRITQLEGAWQGLQKEWSPEIFDSMQLMAHSLAGSGAIFGFAALSTAARELETFLKGLNLGSLSADQNQRVEISSHLSTIRQACLESDLGEEAAEAIDRSLGEPFERQKHKRLIFLVSRNSELAAELSFQLGCFGYIIRTFFDCGEIEDRLDEATPAAIIVDAEPFDPALSEAKRTTDTLKRFELAVPMVVLTSRSDLQSRLQAVRAGVDAFFTTPPDVRKLVEKLEILTHPQGGDPYRILVVQHDYQSALNYSLSLQRAGMTAALATQPEQALKELVDFRPDLVLMDVDLPGVSGPELAAIIRQTDAHVHVPIVFLSHQARVERQLEVMRSGADDLLTQPIELEHLTSVVSYHVQRSRVLRYFMAHDSLTGLLNHTELMERLESDFQLAVRHERPVAYALLHIDHLQQINERYGYFAGDCVIKSLARLLTQRLRRTDIVGRYAGEEFAVIMPDTSGKRATRVLDELRALYAEIPQSSAEGPFYATFSGGVSSLPGHDLAIALHEEARRALRSAVRQGRNRLVLADE